MVFNKINRREIGATSSQGLIAFAGATLSQGHTACAGGMDEKNSFTNHPVSEANLYPLTPDPYFSTKEKNETRFTQ